jgi:hypothetical protein
MRSATHGRATSDVEVTNVSARGFWILVGSRELFLPFAEFPWFQDASIGELVRVERPQPNHLYWTDLDVDLHIDSIEHPENYPLVSRRRRSPAKPPARRASPSRPGQRG